MYNCNLEIKYVDKPLNSVPPISGIGIGMVIKIGINLSLVLVSVLVLV